MDEEATSLTFSEITTRKCVYMLDEIYSSYDCAPFINILYDIEIKLFNGYYNDHSSFLEDLSEIPFLEAAQIEELKNLSDPECPAVEEFCHLPIYSSIHLRQDSLLYAVNIERSSSIHFPIYESINMTESKLPTYRLHIRRKSNFLMEARDSINGVLALFLDAQIDPIEDSNDHFRLKAQVWIVHPLGELQPSWTADSGGWIKIKLVKSKSIDTIISGRIATKIFLGESEIVRKLSLKPGTKLKYARENEIRQYFLHTLLSFSYSKFEYYHSISHDRISTRNSTVISDHAPIQYCTEVFNTENSEPCTPTNEGPNKLLTIENQHSVASHWKKLEEFSYEKSCSTTLKDVYKERLSRYVNAQGYFKRVFFNEKDVIQIFQKSTSSQRVTEIACLLKLRKEKYVGQINQVIFNDIGTEAIGLTMEKYEMTLKEYLKMNYRRFTNYQRMDIILQMIRSVKIIHEHGIAHRDLSTVNFMVNICEDKEPLDDGSAKIDLFLIDFGKSVFFHAEDAGRWWVSTNEQDIYKDETKPRTREELIIWCKSLPLVMARPDHGYKFYRSIQTLPKTSKDHDYLPYLINPAAEDIYSLGTLVWKIFSGMEPWPGIFDTDFKKLRETVSSDYAIDHVLDREVSGDVSKELLRKFIRADPDHRKPATEILDWILQPHIVEALLEEWNALDSYKNIPYFENTRHKPTIQPANTNDENEPRKGRPKGTLNKKTILKMRMGEVGKTRNSDKETDEVPVKRSRGRPKGTFKRKIEEVRPKRPVGRPRKIQRTDDRIAT